MRRITLVITLAIVVAAMLALTVGSALANTNPDKATYTDSFDGHEYNAVPAQSNTEGIAEFSATADRDLPGELDATIFYTGIPGPNVTSEITHGTWVLCSEFTDALPTRDPITGEFIDPECTSTSDISLMGTWKGGTAKWREDGQYAPSPFGGLVWIGIADIKATLGVTGGTVNDVSVKGGSGKVEGTLDHRPLLRGGHATVSGTLTLTLKS
jgi:hypothetical protein